MIEPSIFNSTGVREMNWFKGWPVTYLGISSLSAGFMDKWRSRRRAYNLRLLPDHIRPDTAREKNMGLSSEREGTELCIYHGG